MANFNSSSSFDMILISVFIAGNQSSTFDPWVLACWSSWDGWTWLERVGRPVGNQLPTKRSPFGSTENLSISDLFLQNQHSWNLLLTASTVICWASDFAFYQDTQNTYTSPKFKPSRSNSSKMLLVSCSVKTKQISSVTDLDRYREHLAPIKAPLRWDPLKCKWELHATFSSRETGLW